VIETDVYLENVIETDVYLENVIETDADLQHVVECIFVSYVWEHYDVLYPDESTWSRRGRGAIFHHTWCLHLATILYHHQLATKYLYHLATICSLFCP
jgi:hypothetical protein